MIARRLTSVALVLLCALVGAFTLAGSASALNTHVLSSSFGGTGQGAGQLTNPLGIAVNATTHDVYVADFGNHRVDEFSASGDFLRAWGWGVADGLPAFETCTLTCQAGLPGSGAGQLACPNFIAVDNSGGLSEGDVYVGDNCDDLVTKFDLSGNLISTWGSDGQLNGATAPAGSFGKLAGVAVGSVGTLNVVNNNSEMFEFAQDGTFSTDFDIARETEERGLSVDSAGDFFKVNSGGSVEELTGSNSDLGQVSNSSSAQNLTSDAATGELYVNEGDHIEQYVFPSAGVVSEPDGSTCTFGSFSGCGATDSFGSEILTSSDGVAVDPSSGVVYAGDPSSGQISAFVPALLPDVTTEQASNVQPASVTLNGTVNPDKSQVNDCHFDYGTSASYGLFAPCEETVGSGASPVSVTANLQGLAPDTVYHFRLDASNALGTNNRDGDMTFTTLGPPRVDSESAANITHTTAELQGQIDPFGYDTTYHLEYGANSSYGTSVPVPDMDIGSGVADVPVSQSISGLRAGVIYHYRFVATSSRATVDGPDETLTTIPPAHIDGEWVSEVASTSATFNAEIDPLGTSTAYHVEYGTSTSYGEILSGNVGEGSSDALVSIHRQDLQPSTTYHYRVTTINALGMMEGEDHLFTTQTANGETVLADGRAWELVSPANKQGALIEPLGSAEEAETQAARTGSAISYVTSQAIGEKQEGKTYLSQILSTRAGHGWRSEDITIPYSTPKKEIAETLFDGRPEYGLFSQDLSSAVVEPHSALFSPLPEAKERTLYLRDDADGAYVPLVNENNVPPGAKYGGRGNTEQTGGAMHFLAATPDLGSVVFESAEALTPEAKEGCPQNGCSSYPVNLYEWSAGRLQLVNIWPGGETEPGVTLPHGIYFNAHVISSNGRWIVWKVGPTLYLRDMVDRRTVQIGGSHSPSFQTMSSDGSRIFFLENGDLYEFNVDDGMQTDLTANHGAAEADAGVQEFPLGASEDDSYVYFVAKGVLASGGVSDQDNLYMLHDTGNGWTTTHVATLSSEDEKDWDYGGQGGNLDIHKMTARVSPNGHFVTFMSNLPLTDKDNLDAVSGQRDEEVYLYDGVTGRLSCASCNPTDARPVGIFDSTVQGQQSLVDPIAGVYGNQWLAGSIPAWEGPQNSTLYQQRYLSDSGRLFFDSPDALVPQDTNGLEDVYEYEPLGIGSCTDASVAFSEGSGGCVNLISSGTSSLESVFLDASESGDDVFFLTAARLTAADYDTGYDVYDAHVCSAEVPCAAQPVSPPPCTSGDSCKAAPTPQPEIFGPAPSATFSGTGNVVGSPSSPVVKPRTLTRAQKLKRALAACHEKKKAKRASCERQARKLYGAKKSRRSAKATKKGHR
jgi:hypothetical protein